MSEATVKDFVETLHKRIMPSISNNRSEASEKEEDDLQYLLLSLNEFKDHNAARLRGKRNLSSKIYQQFDFLFHRERTTDCTHPSASCVVCRLVKTGGFSLQKVCLSSIRKLAAICTSMYRNMKHQR